MIVEFEDYNGYRITSMVVEELPNLLDYITIKTAHNQFSGTVINIKKEYNIIKNSIIAIVRIDCNSNEP